jgi:hypothetical protein
MKFLFLTILFAFQFAHADNPGCKAIHDACTAAKQTGKAGWKCAHAIMKGEKVDGITKDFAAEVKDCKTAKAKPHPDSSGASDTQ